MIDFKLLTDIDPEKSIEAFNDAFSDYAVHFSRGQLLSMWRRRGYDSSLSAGAFDGSRFVAFIFNGIGRFNNLPSAYDTGTGTVKDYRSQGLAQKLFRFIEPALLSNGISQYLLEVLCENSPAIAVYKKLGFEISREFTCHVQNLSDIKRENSTITGLEIRELAPVEIIAQTSPAFCDFVPSWQNAYESVMRAGNELKGIGAFSNGTLLGYAISDPNQGDLTQLAVRKDARRNGIGSILFNAITDMNRANVIKAINIETCCISMHEFLKSKNMPVSSRQYEMVKTF